jgi:hypothetical protein
MVWIDAFKLGSTVHHPLGNVSVTNDFASQIIANFARVKSQGYSVTVLREHGAEDSYIYGDVRAMRVADGYVQCAVEFTRDDEKTAYNTGILREWSPGFSTNWMDPHTGEKIGPVLMEISFTSMAYQRNLRVPQDINPGVVLSAHPLFFNTGAEMQDEEKQEMAAPDEMPAEEKQEMAEPTLADVMAMLAEIKSCVMPAPAEEESEVEMSADEEIIAEMSARIAQLEDDKTKMELRAAGITGDRANHLVKLSRVNVELYRETVRLLSAQTEIGVIGSTDVGEKPITAADVAQAARDAKKTGHGKLAKFVVENYPEFSGKINAVRNAL